MTYDDSVTNQLLKLTAKILERNRRRGIYQLFAFETALIIFGMVPILFGNGYMTFFSLGASFSLAFYLLANFVLERVDARIYGEG